MDRRGHSLSGRPPVKLVELIAGGLNLGFSKGSVKWETKDLRILMRLDQETLGNCYDEQCKAF